MSKIMYIKSIEILYKISLFILIITAAFNIFILITSNSYNIYKLNSEYDYIVKSDSNTLTYEESLYLDSIKDYLYNIIDIGYLTNIEKELIKRHINDISITSSYSDNSNIRAFHIGLRSYERMGIYRFIYRKPRLVSHIHIYKDVFNSEDKFNVILHELAHSIDERFIKSDRLKLDYYIDYEPLFIKFILLKNLRPDYNIDFTLYNSLIEDRLYYASNREIFARSFVYINNMYTNGYTLDSRGALEYYRDSNVIYIDDIVFLLFIKVSLLNEYIDYTKLSLIYR